MTLKKTKYLSPKREELRRIKNILSDHPQRGGLYRNARDCVVFRVSSVVVGGHSLRLGMSSSRGRQSSNRLIIYDLWWMMYDGWWESWICLQSSWQESFLLPGSVEGLEIVRYVFICMSRETVRTSLSGVRPTTKVRWMMDDRWWMMDDGWWMMDDRWWMMDDWWWIINDGWWIMDDGQLMMDEAW